MSKVTHTMTGPQGVCGTSRPDLTYVGESSGRSCSGRALWSSGFAPLNEFVKWIMSNLIKVEFLLVRHEIPLRLILHQILRVKRWSFSKDTGAGNPDG